ncbi:MAG TPA: GNAT family N-acetyltransferase [Candidatus Sulfotelmatobacter sp.]|nr:GNAT family N-acetyltransferase [Candidatus Sulfotelmatobacter sp.]
MFPKSDLKIAIFHVTDEPMRITLRHAVAQDFEYCKRLYFAGMRNIIEELGLDMAAQTATFPEEWALEQVRIISADGLEVGWLQTDVRGEGLFVAQLFVDGPFQGQGIGTEVMKQVIGEAAGWNRAVSLAVVKINPALRLYKRLGFRITHQDDRKFYMTRDPDTVGFL